MCMWLCMVCWMQAQDKMPQAISYQAVVRDADGKVVAGKDVGIRVEILKGSAEGEVVFTETHTPTSSKTGTVNLLIGQGTTQTGNFSSIDWGADTYYLQLSMDLNGGSDYTKVSTTQMLPVPYALYAAKAGSVENNGDENTEPETPEVPENNKALFSLVPLYTGSYPRDLMTALNGGTIIIGNPSFLVFYIQYLTGIDLQLTAEIEGLELDSDTSSESTEYGRVYRFLNPSVESLDEINTVLTIKDKDGKILKSYPFKYRKEIH